MDSTPFGRYRLIKLLRRAVIAVTVATIGLTGCLISPTPHETVTAPTSPPGRATPTIRSNRASEATQSTLPQFALCEHGNARWKPVQGLSAQLSTRSLRPSLLSIAPESALAVHTAHLGILPGVGE
jgi:hypothetical protein